jgi:hypothetical protein
VFGGVDISNPETKNKFNVTEIDFRSGSLIKTKGLEMLRSASSTTIDDEQTD